MAIYTAILASINAAVHEASARGADLLAVGDMALSGYPIEDLASRPSFLVASSAAVVTLVQKLDEDGLGTSL